MSENGVEHSQGIHVVHDGPPQGPPLLLIHGSGASGASWSPVVPALAGRHHVIRVDLPGCGQSPPSPPYDVPVQASRVAAVLDDLGLGDVTVVGHSSGGYVATSLAEQRPDLVCSIALISCGPHPDALLPQPLIIRLLLGPPFGPLIWPRRSAAMIRKGIQATAARPVDIPDDAVADLEHLSYDTFRTIVRRNTEYIAERGVPDRLATLTVPVQVIFGTADPRWDPSSVRRYEAVPDARIELLPGVGHLPPFEAPDAIAELLLGWTSRRRTASAPPTVPDP
ncbi:alpha/beta hydrolase [Amycolatopsis sp. NPDC089917]|uniref:alpha/beta fold hydrolase n=1 Tax=Amycolatopsis sp. NPDC089917 TaxID=3155187 RepID=UPI003446806A